MDREWFAVEDSSGRDVLECEFTNKETAAEAARVAAAQLPHPVTVVKYTRREIRTFTKRVLIDEADVTAPV